MRKLAVLAVAVVTMASIALVSTPAEAATGPTTGNDVTFGLFGDIGHPVGEMFPVGEMSALGVSADAVEHCPLHQLNRQSMSL